jgi:hypothetical protein
MADKLTLNEILLAIDTDSKELWDELSESQQKSVTYYTLNRFISNVNGNRETKEHYLLVSNERFNKNLFDVMSKHPKLTWLLACSCSDDLKLSKTHKWIPFKSLKKGSNKRVELLLNLFPNMKLADIETLDAISTDDDIKQYCRDLGWDKKQINAIKF